MINRVYFVLVLSFIALISSCSETDDFEKIPYAQNDTLAIWPLEVGNQWVLAKDTIPDTIRIDTSYFVNNQLLYKSKLSVLLPNFLKNNQHESYISVVDSLYTISINEHFLNDGVGFYSKISLPIFQQNARTIDTIEGTTKFAHYQSMQSIPDSININYQTTILEKNVMEAIGGRVFQDVFKFQASFQFEFINETKTHNLEIWMQPGVGPIKILDRNENQNYILNSFQLFQ